jgi:hypothetical protein
MYRRLAADVRGVVDLDEVALVLAVELRAGGAVGLVADDEVEVRQPVLRAARRG